MSTSPSTFFSTTFAPSWTSSSPKTFLSPVAVPKTGTECDALLEATRKRLRLPEYRRFFTRELARFLGANSTVWSPDRRAALRATLASVGDDAVDAVLEAVDANPRVDVGDEVTAVLREITSQAPSSIASLAARFERVASGAARAVIVRALQTTNTDSIRGLALRALADADVEVRDAAASALAHLGGSGVDAALERRLERERNPVVRQSIEDALDELRAG